ncbi:kinesin motor domain-containing protein [Pseudoscourfieldia marina]
MSHGGAAAQPTLQLQPILSFARIKPDSTGAAASSRAVEESASLTSLAKATTTTGTGTGKCIASFDESGSVALSGTLNAKASSRNKSDVQVFNHYAGCLPPDAEQSHVYDVIANELVAKFVEGYDVDLLCYGQTGAGKTFTMFGPPQSMAQAAASVGTGSGDAGAILKDEHGFILRAGFQVLAEVDKLNASGAKASLHGSMVELSIMTLVDQTVSDLLNKKKACYVDNEHHLQGAKLVPLKTPSDVVHLAAAVETRCVRGTKMNDTSSRSHCVTVFLLSVVEADGSFRQSRLQFFDMMGSERFKGGNAAHDEKQSTKSTMSGFEGIYANLSLSALSSAVEAAAEMRRSKKKRSIDSAMIGFLLTKLLTGSLTGSSLTGMVTCLSQSPRNGDETYLSLKYSAGVSKLLNKPAPQPHRKASDVLSQARKQLLASTALVAKGVQGKYQARREAEVSRWMQEVTLLGELVPDV